jgi:hypothetical protein
MSQAPAAIFKIPTEIPQPEADRADRPKAKGSSGRAKKAVGATQSAPFASGSGRAATRGGGEVIELECGITVYPARAEGGRWRAVWQEDGERQQCEAASEEKLAVKLEKVKIRLEADAPNMRQPGAALISHYLDPDRLSVKTRWSRKHAHTQGRLCAVYAAPVIAEIACEDIKASHTQRIVNAAWPGRSAQARSSDVFPLPAGAEIIVTGWATARSRRVTRRSRAIVRRVPAGGPTDSSPCSVMSIQLVE